MTLLPPLWHDVPAVATADVIQLRTQHATRSEALNAIRESDPSEQDYLFHVLTLAFPTEEAWNEYRRRHRIESDPVGEATGFTTDPSVKSRIDSDQSVNGRLAESDQSVKATDPELETGLTDCVRDYLSGVTKSGVTKSGVTNQDHYPDKSPYRLNPDESPYKLNRVPIRYVGSLAISPDACPRTPRGHAFIASVEAAVRPHRKRAMRATVRAAFSALLSSLAVAALCGIPLRVSMDTARTKGTAVRPEHVRLLFAAGVASTVSSGDWRAGRQTRIALRPEFSVGLMLTDFHYPGLEVNDL